MVSHERPLKEKGSRKAPYFSLGNKVAGNLLYHTFSQKSIGKTNKFIVKKVPEIGEYYYLTDYAIDVIIKVQKKEKELINMYSINRICGNSTVEHAEFCVLANERLIDKLEEVVYILYEEEFLSSH